MADISIIKTPDNVSYNIKDAVARAELEEIKNQTAPEIILDEQAVSGTDDYNLITIIDTLNWEEVYET